ACVGRARRPAGPRRLPPPPQEGGVRHQALPGQLSSQKATRVPLLCSGAEGRWVVAGIDFAELRRRVKMAAGLELLAFEGCERRAAQVRGPCPLQGSPSPRSRSFAAQLGRGVYHCFVCGAGGNVLDLWVARTGLPLYRAALDLCERLHLEVPWQAPQ